MTLDKASSLSAIPGSESLSTQEVQPFWTFFLFAYAIATSYAIETKLFKGADRMATILELAQKIVMAHASTTQMSSKKMIQEIQEVHAALQAIEKGQTPDVSVIAPAAEEQQIPAVTKRKAFGKDKVTCMICGKQMKTLARHLGTEHGLKPSEYRKQFDIPRSQPLAAKSYSESRKQMAIERGLGENLAKARAARGKAKETSAKKSAPKKATSKKTGGKKAGSVPTAE